MVQVGDPFVIHPGPFMRHVHVGDLVRWHLGWDRKGTDTVKGDEILRVRFLLEVSFANPVVDQHRHPLRLANGLPKCCITPTLVKGLQPALG